MVPEKLRQRHVDNGQIGGFISVFTSSMFIFSFFTFLNTTGLIYVQSRLKDYIPIEIFFILIGIASLVWMGFYYVVIMPSQVQFASKQSYIHNNPVQQDLKEIKEGLIQVKKDIEILKTYAKLK